MNVKFDISKPLIWIQIKTNINDMKLVKRKRERECNCSFLYSTDTSCFPYFMVALLAYSPFHKIWDTHYSVKIFDSLDAFTSFMQYWEGIKYSKHFRQMRLQGALTVLGHNKYRLPVTHFKYVYREIYIIHAMLSMPISTWTLFQGNEEVVIGIYCL